MKSFRLIVAAVVLVAMMGLFSSAQAAYVIDFGDGGYAGGTLTWDGTYAVGANIPVDAMKFYNGSSWSYYDTAGSLGSADGNGAAVLNFNTQTNTISITGWIPGLVGTSDLTLLSGSFGSSSMVIGPSSMNFTASGPDRKDELLLQALSIAPDTQFEFYGFSISTKNLVQGSQGYYGTPYSTDISNTSTSVPEPGSLMLLGLGLIGVGVVARRKLNK